MLSTQLADFLKKMISFGNAASSRSSLIRLKTSNKKRGELLRATVSKKNFINLHSAAFVIMLKTLFQNISKTLPENLFKLCHN